MMNYKLILICLLFLWPSLPHPLGVVAHPTTPTSPISLMSLQSGGVNS
ncbi:MAG: hypothetical protein ACXACR_02470 [Candidatus Hodarchaeales archaeon]